MALVGYSDSEDSEDSENPDEKTKSTTPSKAKPSRELVSTKPAFPKVFDRSQPHKVRISLPSTSHTDDGEAQDLGRDAPLAKKPRIGGAFSGFNSLLPAPRNDGPNSINKARTQQGSSMGFHMGASEASALIGDEDLKQNGRSRIKTSLDDGARSGSYEARSHTASVPDQDPAEQVKLVGKPTMFKPLSVVRKPTKKKKPPLEDAEFKAVKPIATSPQALQTSEANELLAHKPRKSLFSTYNEDSGSVDLLGSSEFYETLPETAYVPGSAPQTTNIQSEVPEPEVTAKESPNGSPQPQTLQSLAASLNLTPAQRRQLFGRNAKDLDGLADATVSNFSVSAEYVNNNILRENESTAPAHNPVRSIAPGKHSLQQLVNAATSQKEALEEHFAQSKANKKGAASRYGW